MMRFFGHELELHEVRELEHHDGIAIRAATDLGGGEWLIVPVATELEHLVWVCAPISPRALERVSKGRARVRDALRHSLTGTVEVVTVDHGRSVPDRCFTCAELPADLLPASAEPVLCAA